MIFGEQFLQAKFVGRPAGRVTFVLLVGGKVTGRCSRNFHHQPSGSCQSGIHVLALSLTLPPSTGMGSLVPGAELRRMYQIAVHMPQEEPGPRPISTLLFLDAFPLFLHSLTPLIRNWICPLELREGLGGWNLFPTSKIWGIEKGFYTWENPTGSCSVSILLIVIVINIITSHFFFRICVHSLVNQFIHLLFIEVLILLRLCGRYWEWGNGGGHRGEWGSPAFYKLPHSLGRWNELPTMARTVITAHRKKQLGFLTFKMDISKYHFCFCLFVCFLLSLSLIMLQKANWLGDFFFVIIIRIK